ncbi:MAG: hypothetical protein Q8R78_01100, partial [Candidatus Omnitrophota bacterium]|nr:hypothetical protein [Candidatus Omnitrophota bacterium]
MNSFRTLLAFRKAKLSKRGAVHVSDALSLFVDWPNQGDQPDAFYISMEHWLSIAISKAMATLFKNWEEFDNALFEVLKNAVAHGNQVERNRQLLVTWDRDASEVAVYDEGVGQAGMSVEAPALTAADLKERVGFRDEWLPGQRKAVGYIKDADFAYEQVPILLNGQRLGTKTTLRRLKWYGERAESTNSEDDPAAAGSKHGVRHRSGKKGNPERGVRHPTGDAPAAAGSKSVLSTVLFPRQFQVVQLAALGLGQRDIARQLQIGIRTVQNHMVRAGETLHLARYAAHRRHQHLLLMQVVHLLGQVTLPAALAQAVRTAVAEAFTARERGFFAQLVLGHPLGSVAKRDRARMGEKLQAAAHGVAGAVRLDVPLGVAIASADGPHTIPQPWREAFNAEAGAGSFEAAAAAWNREGPTSAPVVALMEFMAQQERGAPLWQLAAGLVRDHEEVVAARRRADQAAEGAHRRPSASDESTARAGREAPESVDPEVRQMVRVLGEIRTLLARGEGRRSERQIQALLQQIARDGQPLLSRETAYELATKARRAGGLEGRLDVLEAFAFLRPGPGEDGFLFTESQLGRVLLYTGQTAGSSRSRAEAAELLAALRVLGITSGVALMQLVASELPRERLLRHVREVLAAGITSEAVLSDLVRGGQPVAHLVDYLGALRELGILSDRALADIVQSGRREAEVLREARALTQLRQEHPDFDVSDAWLARALSDPARLRATFTMMLDRQGRLPPLDRALTDEQKDYVRLLMLLRQLTPESVSTLTELFLSESERRSLTLHLADRIGEDRRRGAGFLSRLEGTTMDAWDEADYLDAGRLLFSFDPQVRSDVRNTLILAHLMLAYRYRDATLQAVAEDLLLGAALRHNVYALLLGDDIRPALFDRYVRASLRGAIVRARAYEQTLTQSERELRTQIRRFSTRFAVDHDRQPSAQEVVAHFTAKGEGSTAGYDPQLIRRLLEGSAVVRLDHTLDEEDRSLHERIADTSGYGDPEGLELDQRAPDPVLDAPTSYRDNVDGLDGLGGIAFLHGGDEPPDADPAAAGSSTSELQIEHDPAAVIAELTEGTLERIGGGWQKVAFGSPHWVVKRHRGYRESVTVFLRGLFGSLALNPAAVMVLHRLIFGLLIVVPPFVWQWWLPAARLVDRVRDKADRGERIARERLAGTDLVLERLEIPPTRVRINRWPWQMVVEEVFPRAERTLVDQLRSLARAGDFAAIHAWLRRYLEAQPRLWRLGAFSPPLAMPEDYAVVADRVVLVDNGALTDNPAQIRHILEAEEQKHTAYFHYLLSAALPERPGLVQQFVRELHQLFQPAVIRSYWPKPDDPRWGTEEATPDSRDDRGARGPGTPPANDPDFDRSGDQNEEDAPAAAGQKDEESGAPEREAGDKGEVAVVTGEVDEAVRPHRGDDEGVVGQQMETSATLKSHRDVAASHGQDAKAPSRDLLQRVERFREGGDQFRVTPEEAERSARGGGVPFADFTEHKLVQHFPQDDRRSDAAQVTPLDPQKELPAGGSNATEVVEEDVRVDEDRDARGQAVEHLTIPEAVFVRGGDLTDEPRRDSDDAPGALDRVGLADDLDHHALVIAKRDSPLDAQDPILINAADRVSRLRPRGHPASSWFVSTIADLIATVKTFGRRLHSDDGAWTPQPPDSAPAAAEDNGDASQGDSSPNEKAPEVSPSETSPSSTSAAAEPRSVSDTPHEPAEVSRLVSDTTPEDEGDTSAAAGRGGYSTLNPWASTVTRRPEEGSDASVLRAGMSASRMRRGSGGWIRMRTMVQAGVGRFTR